MEHLILLFFFGIIKHHGLIWVHFIYFEAFVELILIHVLNVVLVFSIFKFD